LNKAFVSDMVLNDNKLHVYRSKVRCMKKISEKLFFLAANIQSLPLIVTLNIV